MMRQLIVCAAISALFIQAAYSYDDRGDSQVNQDASCGSLLQSSEIWPTEVDSQVLDLRWVLPGETKKDKDKVVLALTEGRNGRYGGHLYRSENYGKPGSWEKVNRALLDALDQVEKSSIGPDEHELGILEMHFNPNTPHHILLHGNDEFHWTSRDYGRTFERVKSPGGIPGSSVFFKLHPTNPDYILARVRASECTIPGQGDKCSVDLYVTVDFGQSWTSLTHNAAGRVSAFVDFEWGARMHPDPRFASYNDKTIFATVYEGKSKAPMGQWDEDINFVRSDDFFVSEYETKVMCGNAFEIIAGKIFLAVPNDCPYDSTGAKVAAKDRGSGANAVIYVSEDFGENFAESCVPVRHLGDKGYELRETHDRQGVYVLIDHDEEEDVEAAAPVYNLYTCGVANATLFSLSLERVFSVNYYGQRLADWHRVESLPGLFITNQLEIGAMSVETMRERGWKDYVETKITFNGGGHWQHLQAPKEFRNSECNRCGKATVCGLHVHGASSWVGGADGRPSVYSHPSAPGVIMAAGNTGQHLEFDADFQCTWLSRDGGYTWEDVAHGMFIYEYGDHGGLVVMGRHRNEGIPTDTLYYSYDQGLCWHSVKLGEAMYLENIRVEPAGASHTFILHGEQCEKDTRWTSQGFNCTYEYDGENMPKGVMYNVDFQDIRKDWNTCLRDDYEDWSPPTPDLCLLGHNFTYQRRKRKSECFNNKEYERPISSHLCGCSNEDVECDYGYFRKEWFEECEPLEGISRERSCPALDEGYEISTTYKRLIHGDNCTGIRDVIPGYSRPASFNWGHGKHGKHHWGHKDHGGDGGGFSFGKFLMTAVLVIAAAFALFFSWLKFFASEDTRDTVLEILSPFTSCCGSSCGWLADCFGATTSRLAAARNNSPKDAFFSPLAGEDGLDFDDDTGDNAPLFTTSTPADNQA